MDQDASTTPVNSTEEDNALQFIQKIKETCPGGSDTVAKILSVVEQYHTGLLPYDMLIQRVYIYLEGNDDLVNEFLEFLPSPSVVDGQASYPNQIWDSTKYSVEVGNYIIQHTDNHTYNQFLEIIQNWHGQDIKSTLDKINKLFEGNKELQQYLSTFFNSWFSTDRMPAPEMDPAMMNYQHLPYFAPMDASSTSTMYSPDYLPPQAFANPLIPAIPIYPPETIESRPHPEALQGESLPRQPTHTYSHSSRHAMATTTTATMMTTPAMTTTTGSTMAGRRRGSTYGIGNPKRQCMENPRDHLYSSSHHYHEDAGGIHHSVGTTTNSTETLSAIRTHGGEAAYQTLLKFFMLFGQGLISFAEMLKLAKQLYRTNQSIYEMLETYFVQQNIHSKYISTDPEVLPTEIMKQLPQYNASYHLLPSDYIHRSGSQRTMKDAKILNDTLVSFPSGSENNNTGDKGTKPSHRNMYTEAIFRVEDDRFEVDVTIETNRHCMGTLTLLLEELQHEDTHEMMRMKKDALSALDWRSIHRLYKDKRTWEVVEKMLIESPATTIPRIIERLKAKEQQWIAEKIRLEDKWRKIQRENHAKSYDVQSALFKSQDKKTICHKGFVDTIRIIAEKRTDPLPTSQYMLMKEKGFDRFESHLQFDLPDPNIHRFVLRILIAGAQHAMAYADMRRFRVFLKFMVCIPFELPEHWIHECEEENLMFKNDHTRIDSVMECIQHEETKEQAFSLSTPSTSSISPPVTPMPPSTSVPSSSSTSTSSSSSIPTTMEGQESTKEEEKEEEKGSQSPNSSNAPISMFFHDKIYSFYRFYEILYTRVAHIATLCLKASQDPLACGILPPDERESTYSLTSTTPLSSTDRMNKILANVILFIRGETNLFEDEIFRWVGANGYILFTVDKIVNACISHLRTMFTEDITNDLIASFALCTQRQAECSLEGYRNHILPILKSNHLNCYRADCLHRHLSLWHMGNVQDVSLVEEGQFVNAEEFTKYARDFLTLQYIESKSKGVDFSNKAKGDEENDQDEYHEDEEEVKSTPHVRPGRGNRRGIKRKGQEDGDWNE